MKNLSLLFLATGLLLCFSTTVTAQENHGNALNMFVRFGSNSSIAANYEFQVTQDITLAPTARIWLSGDNTFSIGGRGDFYFDRLFNLKEPWDIWGGVDAGFVVAGDSNKDDFNLNLHAGVEYKFSSMLGVIVEFGGGSTSSGGIGLALHF
jgi:hypothetical protein